MTFPGAWLGLVWEEGLTLAAAALAAAWLLRRGVRAWRGKTSGCGCASESPKGCAAAAGMAKDFKAAAARAAGRTPGPSSR